MTIRLPALIIAPLVPPNRSFIVIGDENGPYFGGCSRDGKTVYLDRHAPRTFVSKGRRVSAEPFLVLHEAVERSLLMHLKLPYQFAHQIALRAEEAAVRAAGISWHDR